MTIFCPNCHDQLECESGMRGERVQCPSCKAEFVIPNKHVLPKAQKNANAHFGSFLLGFAFNVIGIFIAHMTDGQEGAKAALRGMLLEMLGAAILILVLK